MNITEKKEYEEKIKALTTEIGQNARQLEIVNKELDSFSYSVSHDLRAPLRAINGYTKILLEDYREKLDDDGVTMMKSVMDNTLKMTKLIDDLLTFSRMGKKEITLVQADMTEIANSALRKIKTPDDSVNKANITISPLLPCLVDQSLAEEVFTNLISNAIKYSAKTQSPTIEVNSYSKDDENIYYVKDNGIGFDMKYADKLFGVFQKLHSPSEFVGGTGIGLAVVKRIITRHGGRVWAEAEPDKGATFYIALSTKNM